MYKQNEVAILSKGVRGQGFTMPVGTEVLILKRKKIDVKHGGYSYTIQVNHPKTGELVVLDEWVTNQHLQSKEAWDAMMKMQEENEAMKRILGIA